MTKDELNFEIHSYLGNEIKLIGFPGTHAEQCTAYNKKFKTPDYIDYLEYIRNYVQKNKENE